MTESLPRCLLVWCVACGVAFMSGVLLMLVDLWERAGKVMGPQRTDWWEVEECHGCRYGSCDTCPVPADRIARLDITPEEGG